MLLKTLTVLTFTAFIFIIVLVGFETPLGRFITHKIGEMPYGDKSLHFLLLAALSALLNATMRRRRVNLWGVDLLLGSLLIATGITLEEFSQAFIPSRHFEVLDMVCNYAGIYAGSFVFLTQKQQHTTNGNQHKGETISFQTIFNRTGPLYDESRHGRRAAGSLGRRQRH